MNDYFFQLDRALLNDAEKLELVEIAVTHKEDFVAYVTLKNNLDGNDLWRGDDLYNHPAVKRLVDHCTLPTIPVFIKQNPKSIIYKHVDDPNKRNTVLSIPLTPKEGYVPTYFFKSKEDKNPIAVARFLNHNPCLLNTQKVHGLINSNVIRINLQLMFNDSFFIVKNKLLNNTLFSSNIFI